MQSATDPTADRPDRPTVESIGGPADRPAGPIAAGRPPAGPFRLAVALVGLLVVVILFGAMVTSTGSGLAFADWPLSDGELMPERSYQTVPGFLEHFHRILAALAGLMSIGLLVWTIRSRLGRAQRRMATLGLVLISVQGLIGGLHVLEGLPVYSAAIHGTLAQVTIATFAIGCYMLSGRWQMTTPRAHPQAATVRRWAVIALVLLIGQTVLGAVARHSGSAHALWTHVGNAVLVFLAVLVAAGLAAGRLGDVSLVARLARALLLLLVAQIVLGFIALLVRTGKHPENVDHLWRALLISTHVLTGALLVVCSSLQAACVFRATAVARGGSRA